MTKFLIVWFVLAAIASVISILTDSQPRLSGRQRRLNNLIWIAVSVLTIRTLMGG